MHPMLILYGLQPTMVLFRTADGGATWATVTYSTTVGGLQTSLAAPMLRFNLSTW
jgi:hypothetical protein